MSVDSFDCRCFLALSPDLLEIAWDIDTSAVVNLKVDFEYGVFDLVHTHI